MGRQPRSSMLHRSVLVTYLIARHNGQTSLANLRSQGTHKKERLNQTSTKTILIGCRRRRFSILAAYEEKAPYCLLKNAQCCLSYIKDAAVPVGQVGSSVGFFCTKSIGPVPSANECSRQPNNNLISHHSTTFKSALAEKYPRRGRNSMPKAFFVGLLCIPVVESY